MENLHDRSRTKVPPAPSETDIAQMPKESAKHDKYDYKFLTEAFDNITIKGYSAGGPGGQNVNRNKKAAILKLDIGHLPSVWDYLDELSQLVTINDQDEIVIKSKSKNSYDQNRKVVLKRLNNAIKAVLPQEPTPEEEEEAKRKEARARRNMAKGRAMREQDKRRTSKTKQSRRENKIL